MVLVFPDITAGVYRDDKPMMDFLMPNGILIPLAVDFHRSMEKIKEDLWIEAENAPLRRILRSKDDYAMICINRAGQKEEILDENQSLNEIRPLSMFMKVIEKQGEKHKTGTLPRQINSLIGKGLQEDLDSLYVMEIDKFKQTMQKKCDKIIKDRSKKGWFAEFRCKYPPRVRSDPLPPFVSKELHDGQLEINIQFPQQEMVYKCRVAADTLPVNVIRYVLTKQASNNGQDAQHPETYFLKVCGLEDYLYGDYGIIQFQYIYDCLVLHAIPCVTLVPKTQMSDIPPTVIPRTTSMASYHAAVSKVNNVCVRNHTENFTIKVKNISRLDIDSGRLRLCMGLYHGEDSLCDVNYLENLVVSDCNCTVNSDVSFNIRLGDLPRMTHLCFMAHGGARTSKKSKAKNGLSPVCWMNLSVFDFRGHLVQGEHEVCMWPASADIQLEDNGCNPIGTVAPHPQRSQATRITLLFPEFKRENIVFQTLEEILEDAARSLETNLVFASNARRPSRLHREELQEIFGRPPLSALCEQDKELIWTKAAECMHRYPDHLNKVLQSVTWDKHDDVAKMMAFLQGWPRLSVGYALDLLDYRYPDENVRQFAVSCLEQLSDDEISVYLLQLVQGLKYESYINSPLAEFLMKRALQNQRFGHQLFWLLRSEMDDPKVKVRFGAILEVYCKSCKEHMVSLMRQGEALKKLSVVNMLVKNTQYNLKDPKSKEKAHSDMRDVLRQKYYTAALHDLVNPLTPLQTINILKIDECRIFDSKKRPLSLIWTNKDKYGKDIEVIYKDGDDLRQDMMILQMLQVMDRIWQKEGLDLRICAYGCIATGRETGMIQKVEARTIANIQRIYSKETKNSKFDKRCLLEWLRKEKDPTIEMCDVLETFILSCAGYCVATYVLGIGDRHNDNIMLAKSGQLFHIDFGHILGNYKKFFSVNREKVPFVLTTSFVHVITEGDDARENFDRFRKYCEDAYLILRRHGSLLITLFMLMLSAGVPQLASVRDVDYVREALALHMSDSEALRHFQVKFREAIKNSWKTSVNWWFHMKATDNT